MGRKTIADTIYEQYKKEELGEDTWLVLYDFEKTKPSTRFYSNISRIMNHTQDGIMIQLSSFLTNDQRAVKSVKNLVKHYGGSVSLFKGELIE
jgi:hypothetical protein